MRIIEILKLNLYFQAAFFLFGLKSIQRIELDSCSEISIRSNDINVYC